MFVAVVLSLGLLAGTGGGQAPLVQWQELVVPGVCTLRIAVPQGWSSVLRSPAQGAVQVRLSPDSGPRAEILITGLAARGDGGLRSAGDIKRAAREMGEQLLSGSVEKRVKLERIDGTGGSGFFYTLTDQRPVLPEGGFRRMTQGIMAVGPLRLAVTVLADEGHDAVREAAFDLLRTAECAIPPRGE